MTISTPYLGLTLYDSSGDQAVTFATFRAVLAGTAITSNFYKIDTAMSGFNTRIVALENNAGAISVPCTYISANYYEASGISGITAYNTGASIIVSLDTTSNGTVTLNINSLGTKSLMKVDSTGTAINLTGSDLVKGRKYYFVYDGTRWLWVSSNSGDQIQIVGTSGNVVTVGSTNNLLGTTTQADLIASTTHSASTKTTFADSDEFPLADSAASYALKRGTWLDFKNLLNDQYTLTTSIASNDLTVALKLADGTSNASTATPINFRVGTSVIRVTGALSVTVLASVGDIFTWDSGKIQANDAQLFVYLINNNGTPQLGVSPSPTLATVASPYYDAGGQTGAVTQSNIVMSGTRNATNTCTVIGLVTVNQLDNNNWQSPTLNYIVNSQIYETTWLKYLPAFTGFSVNPSGYVYYKVSKDSINIKTDSMGTGTSNATSFTLTAPYASSSALAVHNSIVTYDNSAFVAGGGWIVNTASSRTITVYKTTNGTDNFTASGVKTAWGTLDYLAFS